MNVMANKKNLLSWIVVLSMIIPMLLPMTAFAAEQSMILIGEESYPLSYLDESDIGISVNAKDISKAFGLQYDFDTETKSFEILSEEYGKIVFMHNATAFYMGDKIYESEPYFYVRNNVPFVTLDFFCNLFMSSYSLEDNNVVIENGVIGDDTAK